ncbi:MAG: SAM-dependent chlorinase/fluorinase [Rhodospirillaceae bacterium]|nr:SAM-dependent chlorinase/fluorinase [Rhodospirillaceae bacterium]
MIVLFTDFGPGGPYTGQMKAVLAREAPEIPVIDLADDLPACDPEPAAYLLAAFAPAYPPGAVFVCVVDPGVGSDRRPVALSADGRRYVGPDNGLLAIVARCADDARWFTIDWQPSSLSASFHGRDLFAPVAARIARGEDVPGAPLDGAAAVGADWPADRTAIVYIDPYGNAMTGLRANRLPQDATLAAGARRFARLRTFSDAAPGAAFWYENANGLAEIAVNRGRADRLLGLQVGTPVRIETAGGAG